MRTTVRILLVDDNPADRELAKREIAHAIGEVSFEEVTDQVELDAVLQSGNLDLVVTDYAVRWTNGLQVLEQAKAACPDCPVIMFTDSGDEEVAVEGMKRGLDDYVPKKPKRYANLAASVLRAMQRQSERQALRTMERERARVAEALRLNEKFAELGRMAGIIAHEINNPLESIGLILYMLQTSQRLDPSLLEQVRTAESELYRVARIARQTLTFYRETNRPLETDLAELLNSLFSMFGQRFEGPVKMRKHFEPVQRVLAYTSQLRQVFSNLIVNAMEAMGTAGGTLAVYLHPSHHWSNPSVQGVRITISDTGPGILIEDKRRIFEAFFYDQGRKGHGVGPLGHA